MIGVDARHRLIDGRIDYRVDGGVSADPQSDQHHCGRAESGRFRENARRKTKILQELFQSLPNPHFPNGLFDCHRIAKFTKCGAAGFLGRFSAFHAVLDGHPQMRFDLFVDFAVPLADEEKCFPVHRYASFSRDCMTAAMASTS
jgi:hypothetical protein